MPRYLTLCLLLLALMTSGCKATYIPISWGMGPKVQSLSQGDTYLSILFAHYDPSRETLRVPGTSFEEVMMPSEVNNHLGAYRTDSKQIYRNLYYEYTDKELRDVILHELAHHIWFNFMNSEQRNNWHDHLRANPSPIQEMVRRVYQNSGSYDIEDFAFSVEYPRPVDLEALVNIKLITTEERDQVLKQMSSKQASAGPTATVVAAPQPVIYKEAGRGR